ncbi:Na+/H+ antiporter subunit C [Candidatus Endobugula sertula]|uniref:Na+/H+ antiporter subunit C n=1 Tax=Candidatus Endobugula sertula TaxID=62101 RepID=A0A1D2QU89_9GAMM|nr:Na+/H+ antiporter subunit C [Candidatus Endobugula sertula]
MKYLALYNYWIVVIIMMAGFYIMIARHNLVKKIIGLGLFQTGIFYFYVSLGKVDGGTAPIFVESLEAQATVYSNPLPHVLILTAIVVGVATMAMGLALIVRIYEKYDSIEEDEIKAIERQHWQENNGEFGISLTAPPTASS